MAFDGITVAAVTHELHSILLDGRIAKIAQPEPDELLLTIKTVSGTHRLCLCASASLPLVYLTKDTKTNPLTAPNFCMLLRKHIGNGRICGISQPSLERIIEFTIEHRNELGDLCQKYLIMELMGKHSNLILCDENRVIVDSIKHVSSQTSSVREVLPQRPYFVPNTLEKQDPLSVDFDEFSQILSRKELPLGKAIYTAFTGISPVASEDICHRASLDSALPFSQLSFSEKTALYRQFDAVMHLVKTRQFTPVIYYDNGLPKEFSALSLLSFEQAYPSSSPSGISQMLRDYYAQKNTLVRIRQKSADLRQVVQTALERNRKKYHLQSRQLDDTRDRELFRIYGELIHTYGYSLSPKSHQLTALNYYTNEEVCIPLDPDRSPSENAQHYFEKYNKKKRTFETLSLLIEETKKEILYLESVSASLDLASEEEDLIQIKEELIQAGYIKRKTSRRKTSRSSSPLHYLTGDGYHIYVGKNNLQNEELTFSFAEGNDWWFHAKGVPGSHVILKSKQKEPPTSAFEDAGRLAAYYSKSRGNDKVEIDYVQRKHVKKPKGGKPGFVVYYTNYSLVIDSDISSLALLPGQT